MWWWPIKFNNLNVCQTGYCGDVNTDRNNSDATTTSNDHAMNTLCCVL